MKKELYLITYRPNHAYPSAYESIEEALKSGYNSNVHFLFKVYVPLPEPDEIIEVEEIKPRTE